VCLVGYCNLHLCQESSQRSSREQHNSVHTGSVLRLVSQLEAAGFQDLLILISCIFSGTVIPDDPQDLQWITVNRK